MLKTILLALVACVSAIAVEEVEHLMEARGLVGAQFKECFGVVEGKFLTKVTSPAQFAACIKKSVSGASEAQINKYAGCVGLKKCPNQKYKCPGPARNWHDYSSIQPYMLMENRNSFIRCIMQTELKCPTRKRREEITHEMETRGSRFPAMEGCLGMVAGKFLTKVTSHSQFVACIHAIKSDASDAQIKAAAGCMGLEKCPNKKYKCPAKACNWHDYSGIQKYWQLQNRNSMDRCIIKTEIACPSRKRREVEEEEEGEEEKNLDMETRGKVPSFVVGDVKDCLGTVRNKLLTKVTSAAQFDACIRKHCPGLDASAIQNARSCVGLREDMGPGPACGWHDAWNPIKYFQMGNRGTLGKCLRASGQKC